MISYRQYQTGDEKQIVTLWNESLWKDPITPNRFRNLVLLDINFDPEGLYLAFDQNKLIGCAYAVRRLSTMLGTDLEPDNGWIPFFFVDKHYRKSGGGSRLILKLLTL
ncbi:GNAT family N-acetyltransferase [Virgibacillus pantothenticus]|uniref:GNAT family N-acetyltransferase n=1 Tax=Virgibacillus pantothenticus TaxID=1473 RepID=UPI003204B70B